MIKTLNIFLLIFYSLGTFCLPMGDFSSLQDLPEMYQHCKATEDKDMTPIDFLTDHLINIDGLFDKHDNGDEQKRHAPIQNQHNINTIAFHFYTTFKIKEIEIFFEKKINFFHYDNFIISNFKSKVFRPPIALLNSLDLVCFV